MFSGFLKYLNYWQRMCICKYRLTNDDDNNDKIIWKVVRIFVSFDRNESTIRSRCFSPAPHNYSVIFTRIFSAVYSFFHFFPFFQFNSIICLVFLDVFLSIFIPFNNWYLNVLKWPLRCGDNKNVYGDVK